MADRESCASSWQGTGFDTGRGFIHTGPKWGHIGSQQATGSSLILGLLVSGQEQSFVRCWALQGSDWCQRILGRGPIMYTWPEGGGSPCVWRRLGTFFSETCKVGQLLFPGKSPTFGGYNTASFLLSELVGGIIHDTHQSIAWNCPEQPLAMGPSPKGASSARVPLGAKPMGM